MAHSCAQTDDGFSLVEAIIAMFLVAVLALAVLPLIIGASRLSTTNRDLVAANAFANAQLAPVRNAFPVNPIAPTSCATLTGHAVTGRLDEAKSGLTADIAIGACPATYPGTVLVTVTVYEGTDVLVTLPTKVLVSGV